MGRDADTALFSLRETAVLSRLPESQVRREIERKLIAPAKTEQAGTTRRLLFDESRILYFAMLRCTDDVVMLSPEARARTRDLLLRLEPGRILAELLPPEKKQRPAAKGRAAASRTARRIGDAWRLVHSDRKCRGLWIGRLDREWSAKISRVVTVNWDALIQDIGPRIELYRQGRERVRRDKAVLGGEPVFAGTRLAVRHIGGMRIKGEPVERILEDYPYLSAEDVEFAALFVAANPPVGRPKGAGAPAL